MRVTTRIAPAAMLIAVALGGCTGAIGPDSETSTHPSAATTTFPATPETPPTTTSPLDRYNPEHDPATCVKVLPDGQVEYVKILLVPGEPAPAYVNGAKCG